MALTRPFHRQHQQADENQPGVDENHASTRDYHPGGPAVVGHDDRVERPHNAEGEAGHLRAGDAVEHHRHAEEGRRAALHDTYGGMNWGACFFGWLVAIGVTVLLGAIISAVASAVGANQNWTQTDLQEMSGTVGIAAAITLAVVMFVGYYAGGYVAGRMSRFDARRQGLGVWIVAIVAMIIAAIAGTLFGTSYDIMRQVDLPSVGLSTDQLSWGAVITGIALLAVMLVGAVLGAASGQRYHTKIDRAVYDD